MKHESYESNTVNIEDCTVTFSSIHEKPYISKDIVETINEADILILPVENFRDTGEFLFPEETDRLYHHFKKEASRNNLNVEICISDDDFQELEMHSECITIATILINIGAFDMAINIISSFLYEKLKSFNINKRANLSTNVSVIVEQKGKSKIVKYDGSIENFDSVMKSVAKHIFK